MNLILKPIPGAPEDGPKVSASLTTFASELILRFQVEDPSHQIDWGEDPSASVNNRGQDLWKKTCFELFLSRAGSDIYHEFNWAPNGAWDAFSFKSYREKRDDFVSAGTSFFSETAFELNPNGSAAAHIKIRSLHGSRLQFLIFTLAFEFQISMVMKLKNGETIHSALRHSGEKPDFHKRDAFIVFSSNEIL